MTRDEAHQVFERLRGRFAAKHPAVAKVRLRLARKHFLKHPAARDLAWYEPSERTVYLMERALAGHAGRVSGLLAHELGHAADSDTSRPYAELRADALAKAAIGRPIRYDAGDVQNLEVGVTPRPPYLHENKPMKRNPPLVMGEGAPVPQWTAWLRSSKLYAKSNGSIEESLLSAGYYAKKNEEPIYLYAGNSYGWAIWRVSRKRSEALDPINNTGTKVFVVQPDLSVTSHDVERAAMIPSGKGKKRNPRTPFSNSPPPASSNWSGFARAADVGELDLDAIADATGYGGWYNLDRSISPSTIANERNTPSGSVRFTKFAKAIRAHSLKLSKASADRIARALLAERPYKRNPTTAYHRARGDAQLVLAEDAYKKAKAMSRRGDAKGAHDSLIHAHRMAALAESDLTDGASTKAAKAKSLTWWKAYSQLAQSPKRNPAKGYKMPEAQARHTAEGLLTRMKADGADTFAKKVKWVKKHMPNIDRPRTFVGWVTKGERGRVVYQRNPDASYAERVKAAEDARAKLFRSLKGKTKEDLIRILGGYYRIHGLTTKSSITDLKYAITSAAHPDPRPPRSRNPKASVKQQILALDRRIEAMEEAGYAPHSLIEKRDLLVAKVRRRKP